MRVTLDLTDLLRTGHITSSEHDRLLRLGVRSGGTALVNVLIGFGVLAVTGGVIALVPSTIAGAALGAVLMAAGIALNLSGRTGWSILANICILLAALFGGAGLILLSQGYTSIDAAPADPILSFTSAGLLVAGLFAACAVPARSALLAALAVLMLFVLLGSSSAYSHAFYELQVRQPLLTVGAFSALTLVAHLASRVVVGEPERLLTTVARTSLFLVNLGFWVGSLWGDDMDWLPRAGEMPKLAFSLAWAAGLLAVGVWAGMAGRRWVLNLVAVFAGIHLYTQWFEHLGATPGSVLLGGLLLLGGAVALWRFNQARPALEPAGA